MDVFYGKIRMYATASTQLSITSGLGNTQTITVPSGATFVDRMLAGLEEYSITDGNTTQTVLLNINAFEEVTF